MDGCGTQNVGVCVLPLFTQRERSVCLYRGLSASVRNRPYVICAVSCGGEKGQSGVQVDRKDTHVKLCAVMRVCSGIDSKRPFTRTRQGHAARTFIETDKIDLLADYNQFIVRVSVARSPLLVHHYSTLVHSVLQVSGFRYYSTYYHREYYY
jgi:hypothetical protein